MKSNKKATVDPKRTRIDGAPGAIQSSSAPPNTPNWVVQRGSGPPPLRRTSTVRPGLPATIQQAQLRWDVENDEAFERELPALIPPAAPRRRAAEVSTSTQSNGKSATAEEGRVPRALTPFQQAYSRTNMVTTHRSRNFAFTFNNYTAQDVLAVRHFPCSYLVFGFEVSESGTPHLQGTVVFPNAKTLTSAIAAFPKGAHLGICIDMFASIKYCMKDGDWEEHGTKPVEPKQKGTNEQGRWAGIKACAVAGDFEAIDPKTMVMYVRQLQAVHTMAMVNKPCGHTTARMLWFYGESGSGKSRKAAELMPGFYPKMCNKWWDGYTTERFVVLEDVDKSHEKLGHHLKIWGDRYDFLAEMKGSSRRIRPDVVCVTSNYHPGHIFTDEGILKPLMRRFDVYKFSFAEDGETTVITKEEGEMPPYFINPDTYRLNNEELAARARRILGAVTSDTTEAARALSELSAAYQPSQGPGPLENQSVTSTLILYTSSQEDEFADDPDVYSEGEDDAGEEDLGE